jgi:hypothetical protein
VTVRRYAAGVIIQNTRSLEYGLVVDLDRRGPWVVWLPDGPKVQPAPGFHRIVLDPEELTGLIKGWASANQSPDVA